MLTMLVYRLNLYSSAVEDVGEKDVPSTDSNDERSTGCSVIPTELNDSVFTTQPTDAANVPLVDVSQPLIEFDETQIDDKLSDEPSANATFVKNEEQTDKDLMNFDVPSEQPTECDASAVKSQPSNCSIITLSSEGSQETATQQNDNQNADFDEEDMFDKSISCPPSQLPDDLFENSDQEDAENLATTGYFNFLHICV